MHSSLIILSQNAHMHSSLIILGQNTHMHSSLIILGHSTHMHSSIIIWCCNFLYSFGIEIPNYLSLRI